MARPKKRKAGHCMECGEVLEGQKQRWCGAQCASRVYSRARRIAFDAYVPPNTECQICSKTVEPGHWYCGPECRLEARKQGLARPSRYDHTEFFK